MYTKTAFLLAWLAASYVGLVWGATTWWQAVPLAISLALAMAGIGFNIQHDGNHGAYSRHPAVNKAAALSLNLLGGDAYFWHYKHNIAHHTYPNISGADNDIYMARVRAHVAARPPLPVPPLSAPLLWALYALLAVKWQLFDDFRSMIRPGVAATRVPRPRGWDQVWFWTGKACFLTLAFGVPAARGHRLAAVVGLYLVTIGGPRRHAGDRVPARPLRGGGRLPRPRRGSQRIEREWTVAPDRDRGRLRARQPPAHLVPGRAQLPDRAPPVPEDLPRPLPGDFAIVEATCRSHGIRHSSHRTMRRALRSHVRWLRHLGREGDGQPARTRKSNPTLGGSVAGSQR